MHFRSFYQSKKLQGADRLQFTQGLQNILKPKIKNVTPLAGVLRPSVPLSQLQAAPALAAPPHSAPWPHIPHWRGRCSLEMHLPSMVPQSRQSLCPKAALWSSSFVSGSPLYCALSEVIWPSWTILFPCCPWASQCWLPLCPYMHPTYQGALLLLSMWVVKGCLVSSVGAAAGLPSPTFLFPLLCVFTIKPQPKSLLALPSLLFSLHSCSVNGGDDTKCNANGLVACGPFDSTLVHTKHGLPTTTHENVYPFCRLCP